tara:strand:+ start:697 stop:828 length:132 start_codon:yes stop_codon:yes gene_type:complete
MLIRFAEVFHRKAKLTVKLPTNTPFKDDAEEKTAQRSPYREEP